MKKLITKEGMEILVNKLNLLKKEEIACRETLEESKTASAEVSENVEFEMAKEEMAKITNSISDLVYTIQNSKIIDTSTIQTETVQAYNKVMLKDVKMGKELNYMLVSDKEIDVKNGKISYSSPMGAAIMGKKVGDTVEVKLPVGMKIFEILEIYV